MNYVLIAVEVPAAIEVALAAFLVPPGARESASTVAFSDGSKRSWGWGWGHVL